MNLGNPETSINYLDRAIELSPNLAHAYLWRGNSYGASGFRNKEIADFETAYKLDPRSVPAMTNLARNYVYDGRAEEAAKILDRLKEIAGEDSSAHTYADIFTVWAQGEIAKAHQLAVEYKERSGTPFVPPIVFTAFQLKNLDVAVVGSPFPGMKLWMSFGGGDRTTSQMALEQLKKSSRDSDKPIAIVAEAKLLYTDGDESTRGEAAELILELDQSIDGPLFGTRPDRIDAPWALDILQAGGRMEEANALIKTLKTCLEEADRRGYGLDIAGYEAMTKAVEGDYDGAMASLEKLTDQNYPYWSIEVFKAFKPLKKREDFNRLMDKTYRHINAERAKLGWEPVSRDADAGD